MSDTPNEDPRMLREQIRVADAAYQLLHEDYQRLSTGYEESLDANRDLGISREDAAKLLLNQWEIFEHNAVVPKWEELSPDDLETYCQIAENFARMILLHDAASRSLKNEP